LWEFGRFDEHKREGEDTVFCHAHLGSIIALNGVSAPSPQIIADYHGGNTGNYGNVEPHFKPIFDRHQPAHNPEWRRALEWDAWTKREMENA
jgi:hypothetical protein